MWQMASKGTKITIAITIAILVLAIAAAAEFYQATQSATNPLVFTVSAYPNKVTIMQAQNSTITIGVACLKGIPEPVTLTASGGPNGTIYQFTNQTEQLAQNGTVNTNLAIMVPPSAVSDTYNVNITASTADGQTNSTVYTLIVVNSEIQVLGTVTATSCVYISPGRSVDSFPTEIIFESIATNQTYQTHSLFQQ